MPIIPNTELLKMREEAESLMIYDVSIIRVTKVDDGGGGFTETTDEVATTVCDISAAAKPTNVDVANVIHQVNMVTINVPYDTNVIVGDTLQISDDGSYSVNGFYPQHLPITKRLACTKLE